MRKLISLILTVLMLIVCISLPISASAEQPENVMSHVADDIFSPDGFTMYGCSVEVSRGLPANIFNGNREYDAGSSSSYVSWRMTALQEDIKNGTASLYNADGEQGGADGKYLAILRFRLDKVYTVGSFAVYFQKMMNTSLDGFDVLVSETGAAGSWSVVASTENMTCGKAGGKWNVSSDGTYFASGEFAPAKAGYIALGITQPRCIHLDAMMAAGTGTTINAPHYFRITEFEVFTATEPETTPPPAETRPAPIETTAPPTETAEPPAETTPPPSDSAIPPEDGPDSPSEKTANILSLALLGVAAALAAATFIIRKKSII